jgi:hypothetical protein
MDIACDNGLVVRRPSTAPTKTKPPNPLTGTVANVVFDLKPTHHEAK